MYLHAHTHAQAHPEATASKLEVDTCCGVGSLCKVPWEIAWNETHFRVPDKMMPHLTTKQHPDNKQIRVDITASTRYCSVISTMSQ